MSPDFWAGYISGAASIIIGNPLDILKVRLQSSSSTSTPLTPSPSQSSRFLLGTAAPILTYGALNALLFVSYNRTQSFLSSPSTSEYYSLSNTFYSGCIAGLAVFFVSTPTELIKCRAQLSSETSWGVTRDILRRNGVKGLYFGGKVTAVRDSVGYGFYFWGYEVASRIWEDTIGKGGFWGGVNNEGVKSLICGGIAGVVSWGSIFPLDVVKTRVQGQQVLNGDGEGGRLLGGEGRKKGAWEVMKITWREGGIKPFWRGIGVCSLRAFVVNAVQWGVYEWIMRELGEGRGRE
ncbi:mitochondrial carrier domain-containing protein, partial [Podospora fimiseda]